MSFRVISRLFGAVIFGFIGWQLGTFLADGGVLPVSFGVSGSVLALLFTPWLMAKLYFSLRRSKMERVSAHHLLAGTIGLVIGLIISALLTLILSPLPSPFGMILSIIAALVFSYLGVAIMVIKGREILSLLGAHLPEREGCILLDTSVIIDGRIADITRTGFIEGTILIPRFVLDELQYIADSPDSLRRNRGRRGLDMLNRLQKEAPVPVEISEMDVEDIKEVDGKLVELGKRLNCPIVSNDYSLNRVAELQGVRVLNINRLASAVRAVVLPGETLDIHIVQEGKETGQGVGYLDDGTMVVVENGRRYMNSTLSVVVTRALQTMAGRMIFAQPESEQR